MSMKVLYGRCAGCDVHKDGITVHIVVPEGQATRTFGTTTNALLTLVEWLLEQQVTHVAMESTGVYWKPVYSAPGKACAQGEEVTLRNWAIEPNGCKPRPVKA